MASDVRECDVCGKIFKISKDYCESLELPVLYQGLDNVIESIKTRIRDGDRRAYILTCKYDLCNHCLLRLCEVLQGLHSIRGKEPQ